MWRLADRQRLSRLLSLAAISFLIIGITFGIDWWRDNGVLAKKTAEIVAGLVKPSERIIAVNDWVYQNQGFAKNQKYFLLKSLGPTPIQVMQTGGDCADKSRLESAMLAQLGISSGLVMISECEYCPPTHIVVEADYEAGRMIADPIWNIVYHGDVGRYFGKRELSGTSQGWARARALQNERGPAAKIAVMPRSDATFDHVYAINWRKNGLTKVVEALLGAAGLDPTTILRPHVLEDPKLFLAIMSLMLSIGTYFLGFALSFRLHRFGLEVVSNPTVRKPRLGY